MAFDPQPVLRGQTLGVRPLRQADFDALYAVARDPLLWEQHPASDRHVREVFERFVNRELKQLMLGHAFRFVERVVFLVGVENRRSQRAPEKIGAKRAGTRRDGSGHESVLFELARQDFTEPPEAPTSS